jgi:hypothetical protein
VIRQRSYVELFLLLPSCLGSGGALVFGLGGGSELRVRNGIDRCVETTCLSRSGFTGDNALGFAEGCMLFGSLGCFGDLEVMKCNVGDVDSLTIG